MARKTKTKIVNLNEEILVSVFKDIHIHFTGDVYLLAVWVAMSDRTKSTSTNQSRTTLKEDQGRPGRSGTPIK